MSSFLIADSGGSKTDWCYVNDEGVKSFFATESYHPDNWSESFIEGITKFWRNKQYLTQVSLVFYGSGCFNKSNASQLQSIFKEIGFINVNVQSDLHGAGLACYENKSGFVVILGTGSVLFQWTGNKVENIVGGKGHLKGDEGSGFYFGKMIYDAYQNGDLSPDQKTIIDDLIDFEELKEKIDNDGSKKALSSLPFLLKDHKHNFAPWHTRNIAEFCDSHFMMQPERISLIGGYVKNHQEFVRSEMERWGMQIDNIIEKPIERLVEQIATTTE